MEHQDDETYRMSRISKHWEKTPHNKRLPCLNMEKLQKFKTCELRNEIKGIRNNFNTLFFFSNLDLNLPEILLNSSEAMRKAGRRKKVRGHTKRSSYK